MASQIFTNNIQVTFLAFAGGMLLGLGTLYVLFQNGMMLGAVGGLAIGAGNGRPFFELVTAHGVLELSCIVVAGAAGLRLGWAIIDPGNRTRGEALRDEARAAVEIVLGTAAWLVVAGLVEGFLTPVGHRPHRRASRRLRPRRHLLGSRAVARRPRAQVHPANGVSIRREVTPVRVWSEARPRLEPEVGAHARLAEQRGRRLDHGRAGVPQPFDRRGRGRRARRARPRPRRRRAASRVRRRARASRSGSRTDAITTACRRASTGTASSSERAAASSTRSVNTTMSARLHAADGAEREVVVAVDGVGSTSRIARTTALPPAAARARAGAGSRRRTRSRRSGRRARRRRARPS